MWLEYLVDRIGGPKVFDRIKDGDTAGWGDPAGAEGRADGHGNWSTAAPSARTSTRWTTATAGRRPLLAKGKAAMHLMGSWEYSTQLGKAPDFARRTWAGAPFPDVRRRRR